MAFIKILMHAYNAPIPPSEFLMKLLIYHVSDSEIYSKVSWRLKRHWRIVVKQRRALHPSVHKADQVCRKCD